jgi:M6 family metalloprotease-like protein
MPKTMADTEGQPYLKKMFLGVIVSVSLLVLVMLVMAGNGTINNRVLADSPPQVSISGWLTVGIEEIDPDTTFNVYTLTDDQGQSIRLFLNQDVVLPTEDVGALHNRYVTVVGQWTGPYLQGRGGPALQVQAIQLTSTRKTRATQATKADIIGAQPWIWILCKFADDAAEPRPLSYFQTLHADLDPYFGEVSYAQANIAGSNAVGWYSLPQVRSYYVYDMNSDGSEDIDFDRAAQDCTNVAEAEVDFSGFYGLNLMFNGELDAAYGVTTGVSLTLDGLTKTWPSVFIDNKGSYNMALTAHEMYHGFGLGHSAVRNADGTVFSGSSWDPVGIGACGFNSCTPSHIPAPQKDELGWIGVDKTYTVTLDSQTITLEALALPQTDNYLMAKIFLADNHFYTLEARRQAGYDQKVPGSTVLIHEVNLIPGAFRNGHIGLIPEPGQAEPWGTGAMWTVGEIFTDVTNGITVSVLAATASGFEVQIEKRPIATTVIYVDADASGANDGSSWANAYTDLQAALAVAQPVGRDIVEIWVAEGTYKPTSSGDRQATFQLKDNVFIYGGFAGSETDRSQRNISAHPTILSGDLQGNDNDTISSDEPTRAENSYHVVSNSGSQVGLDGVIISGGNANGDSADGTDRGGGLYNAQGDPGLNNLIFRGNTTGLVGGGMYNIQGSPALINVVFSGNYAKFRGGGLYNVFSEGVKLTQVSLNGNTASFYSNSEGGGIYNFSSAATIANGIFWNNHDSTNDTGSAAQLTGDNNSSFVVSYSLVQGSGVYTGTGNINGAPLFVDADGPDDIAGTADDNLQLQDASPAIDAGDNTIVPAEVTLDLAGNSRFIDHSRPDTGNGTPPIVDMGAYEAITTIENQAPTIPGNPSPADGASSVPLTPTLTWSGGDPDSPVVTYTVAFGSDDPPAVVSTTTTTSYKPPLDLLENAQYYWRITASDGSLSSAGPIWTFTTISTTSSHAIYLPVVLK